MHIIPQVLDQTLQEIAKEQITAGESVSEGATDFEIERVIEEVKTHLNIELPQSYVMVLRQRNGIDYDGVVFYSASDTAGNPSPSGFWQGVVASNQAWRSDNAYTDLLILGDSSMDIFAFDPALKEFTRRDRITGDIITTYHDAVTMVEDALKSH